MATCPRCSLDLVVRQATPPGQDDAVDVDCCGSCGGIWIDGAELGRASPHLGALFRKRKELVLTSRPADLACPRCGGALAEVGVNEVAVDWCGTCFGVWLDGGEYQSLTAPRRSVQPSEVSCYVCHARVALGDTYYTDRGLVCSGCRGEEMKQMAEREVEYQRALREYQAAQREEERQAARQRIGQLRSDMRHATHSELSALRTILDD